LARVVALVVFLVGFWIRILRICNTSFGCGCHLY